MRDGKVSYYIHDGHGDVRALVSDDGKITDRYRYSAYGELLEKSGNTENHYLYTGEYHDGTSSLYYLRARYMNPSTGSFLTMDTYEGSIYEPATLHRYLYANGNPVSYSDPGGHFAGLIGSMATTAISAVMRNIHTLNVMGLISGVTNAAVTGILGGSGEDIGRAFITGYLTGFGLGAVMYAAAAFEIMTIAEFLMIGVAANTVMNIVLMTASVISGDSRSALVYGTLSVLSFVSFCQAYNVNGSVMVTGGKGCVTAEIQGTEASEAAVSNSGSKTNFYVTSGGDVIPSTGYRYVSKNAPYLDDMSNTMIIPGNPDGTYFSFDNYNIANPGALQVPHDASVKVGFDTMQIIDDISTPYGNWGKASYLEPITQDFPQFGPGGATQVITHSKIKIDFIIQLPTK